ncbi:hypothetical protein NDU88_004312 [Pleurodeles waltl]|uniref:Fibronectin type-III domain-containing protein n=1 Tax=Pleurodeles waltl TaxID=8319 RepID=A0AAV7TS44_PLEWA|nr:hypothetical protein NDU88_004312 [Pleurodeles waltl]
MESTHLIDPHPLVNCVCDSFDECTSVTLSATHTGVNISSSGNFSVTNITYANGTHTSTEQISGSSIIDLQPWTSYSVDLNNGTDICCINFTTGPHKVPLENITLNNLQSTNSIEVKWIAPPDIVQMYIVSLHGDFTKTKTISTVQPVIFQDLLPGREYKITVTTISGPFNETSLPVTEATYPAQPGTLILMDARRNSINLSWDPPLNMSGLTLIYNITYSSLQGNWIITNNTEYANIENLTSGTNYTISVVTVGVRNYTSPPLLTSSYTRPSQVSSQDITLNNRKSPNNIEVNWSAPPGLVEWYDVYLQGAVTQNKTTSSIKPIKFTDLLPGREYSITITTISGPFNETSAVVTEATCKLS